MEMSSFSHGNVIRKKDDFFPWKCLQKKRRFFFMEMSSGKIKYVKECILKILVYKKTTRQIITGYTLSSTKWQNIS